MAPPDPPGFDIAVALAHLRGSDPELGRLIDSVGPYALVTDTVPTAYAALAEAIVHQQLKGRAAATIFGRLCALFPGDGACPSPEQLLAASDDQLRSAGLSRGKRLALQDLARRTLDGTVAPLTELHAIDDETIIERLSAVRGIGRWTVEMFLIFRLGRPDVLPGGDYGLRRGYAAAFGLPALPTPAEVAERGSRWAPYRTVASWYLWRAAEGGGLLSAG